MASFDELTIIEDRPDHYSLGCYRNITIVAWHAQATGPAVAQLNALTRKVVRDFPEGFSNVQIIPEGIALPDPEARAGLKQRMKEVAGQLGCLAVIVGGEGFWASAIRAAVTGMWQSLTLDVDRRMCGTAPEAANWLAPRHRQRTGTIVDPTALTSVLYAAGARKGHA